MPRYINIEPYETEGDSHCLEWRVGTDIKHKRTKDIPTAEVVGIKDLYDPNISGKITKYYCTHCEKFKRYWQTTEGMGESIYRKGYVHCKHCGREVIGLTQEFVDYAVLKELRRVSKCE